MSLSQNVPPVSANSSAEPSCLWGKEVHKSDKKRSIPAAFKDGL